MTASNYARLLAVARRHARRGGEAQDLLNDALLAAMRCGRSLAGDDDAWIAGTIRNLALMQARSASRRRRRDGQIAPGASADPTSPEPLDPLLARIALIPRGARIVALLALQGMDRAEIASALALSDDALRQRLMTLRKHLDGLDVPASGIGAKMALGSMRASLLRVLHRTPGIGTRDPDGHLLIFSRRSTSHSSPPRQHLVKEN